MTISARYRGLLSSYGGFGIKRRARPMLGQRRPCAAANVINRQDRRDAIEIVATTIADRIGSVGDQRTTVIQSCWFGCGSSPISAAVNQPIMTLTNQLATAPDTQIHAESTIALRKVPHPLNAGLLAALLVPPGRMCRHSATESMIELYRKPLVSSQDGIDASETSSKRPHRGRLLTCHQLVSQTN